MPETIDTDQLNKATEAFNAAIKQAEKAIQNVPEPHRSKFKAQIRNIQTSLKGQDGTNLTKIIQDLSTFVQHDRGS